MRITIERLRSWILLLAGLLLAGILVFFGYARWQVRRVARDLPGKLGITIQQSTAGYTFSKSEGNHTVFTVHAAKMLQYKGAGRAELHDVSITLYAPNGAQADRIYGDDFDYDPVLGLVRATGPVQIDLQGPPASDPHPSATPADGDKNIVHVKTAGLVFNQKTGLANTPERLEFQIAGAAGSAVGAEFDSRTGVLLLQSEVAFSSSVDGDPLVVRARRAQFERASQQLFLLQDATAYGYTHSVSDQAIVHFRDDGSVFRIDSIGHVVTSNQGQQVGSQTARIDLDEKSNPLQALLSGGVSYTVEDSLRRLRGNSDSAILTFGPRATVKHAQLRTNVTIADSEQVPQPVPQAGRPSADSPVSTTRNVQASQIDIDFAPSPQRKPLAEHVLAVGNARLDIRTLYANTPPQESEVQGDQILVTLRDGTAVSSLRGTGHTRLMLLNSKGVRQTSTGDHLLLTFAAAPHAKTPGSPAIQQASQLESSEQTGNVTFDQQSPPSTPAGRTRAANRAAGSMSMEISATAQRAVYSAATQMVTLFGDPRIREENGEVTAGTIQLERASGDATASGGVKATYRQTAGRQTPQPAVSFGGQEPVHVIADHARFDHSANLATFYGKSQDARLWQGDDSISAPVVELSRSQQTLSAHGTSTADGRAVTAILTSLGAVARSKPGQNSGSSVVRVKSRTLLYSDPGNRAAFRGGVVAQNASGVIRADSMDVYFSAPDEANPDLRTASMEAGLAAAPRQGKQVQRIVSSGNVLLEQPARQGYGEELVYTTADRKFVLTGTSAAPPRIVDREHGTVTGGSLIFNDRDDSVIVSGGPSKAVTETRTAK
ncbi:MAG TPA: LptA/OstA family protein [Acidobacteriaceae bacterium]|nr:LptA/OstA family protein [Acidobacteriaceae bacterium]